MPPRNKHIMIRVSEDEMTQINKAAAADHRSPADFIRALALKSSEAISEEYYRRAEEAGIRAEQAGIESAEKYAAYREPIDEAAYEGYHRGIELVKAWMKPAEREAFEKSEADKFEAMKIEIETMDFSKPLPAKK